MRRLILHKNQAACLFLISAFIIDLTDVHNLQLDFCYLSKNEQRNNNKINMIFMGNGTELIGATHEPQLVQIFSSKPFLINREITLGVSRTASDAKSWTSTKKNKCFDLIWLCPIRFLFSLIIQKSKSSMWRNSFLGKLIKKLIKLMSHKKLASKIDSFFLSAKYRNIYLSVDCETKNSEET